MCILICFIENVRERERKRQHFAASLRTCERLKKKNRFLMHKRGEFLTSSNKRQVVVPNE